VQVNESSVKNPREGLESDQRLAGRALRGDHAAYEQLFERHFAPVHAYTRRRSASRAAADLATTRALTCAFSRLDHVARGEDLAWLSFVSARAALGTPALHAVAIETPR
jgi:DNA-directed RNA polymerase specialized sigma24 family protein